MLAKARTCAVIGLDGALVEVEVDIGHGLPAFAISSATREGVQVLMNETARRLNEIQRDEAERQRRLTADVPATGVVLRPEPEDAFTVEEAEDGFRVHGKRIDRMVAMTDT